jgi:hypothetical protein
MHQSRRQSRLHPLSTLPKDLYRPSTLNLSPLSLSAQQTRRRNTTIRHRNVMIPRLSATIRHLSMIHRQNAIRAMTTRVAVVAMNELQFTLQLNEKAPDFGSFFSRTVYIPASR